MCIKITAILKEMLRSNFFKRDSRDWDADKATEFFLESDATLILATPIPQFQVQERVAWTRTIYQWAVQC